MIYEQQIEPLFVLLISYTSKNKEVPPLQGLSVVTED